MKMKLYGSFALLMALSMATVPQDAFAQRKPTPAQIEKPAVSSNAAIGDRYMEGGEFALAADYFQRALRKKPGDMYAQYRLGDAYQSMMDYARAEFAYQRVVQSRAKGFPLAGYQWALMLKINGKYDLAKREFQNFLNTFRPSKPDEQIFAEQARVELSGCDLAIKELTMTIPDYQMQVLPAPVNALQSDYSPAIYENDTNICLTSNRPESRGSQKDPILGQSFSDFYFFTKVGADWQRSYPSISFDKINSKLAEGAGVFTADKLKFYYTSCANEDNCQIYMTQLVNSKWTDPVPLNNNVNLQGYGAKQPSISPKGDTLFFVSNRPGGLGANDIYYSVNRGNDNWDIAVNLGEPVNTPFNDMSPCYYGPEHMLFFASNGREGFGGLDIFVATGRDFDKSVNIGLPFNSNRDDFYFIQGKKYGYLSSNRENGIGSDDIYTFQPFAVAPTLTQAILMKDSVGRAKPVTAVAKESDTSKEVEGVVLNRDKKPEPGAEVELTDEKGAAIKKTKTDKDGKFAFRNLPDNRDYNVGKAKKNKKKKSDKTNATKPAGEEQLAVSDVKKTRKNKPATRFLYENIYFDFDSDRLRPEAAKVLDEIIAYSKDNSDIQIEMNAYTDNIGNPDYNKKLAARRAATARQYLESNGIEATKFTERAKGATSFLGNNRNPLGRQLNRRVEFYVLGGTKVKGSMVFIADKAAKVSEIAEKFSMTEQEVREANNISGDEVNPYQPIRVKRTGAAGVVAPATMALTGTSKDVMPEFEGRPNAEPAAVAASLVDGQYEIQKGQTLYSIARLFGQSAGDIIASNALQSGKALAAGAKLKITPKAIAGRHTVKAGESLESIAKQYGTSASKLIMTNLMQHYPLTEGMTLKVK